MNVKKGISIFFLLLMAHLTLISIKYLIVEYFDFDIGYPILSVYFSYTIFILPFLALLMIFVYKNRAIKFWALFNLVVSVWLIIVSFSNLSK